jgi:hypothetical protein
MRRIHFGNTQGLHSARYASARRNLIELQKEIDQPTRFGRILREEPWRLKMAQDRVRRLEPFSHDIRLTDQVSEELWVPDSPPTALAHPHEETVFRLADNTATYPHPLSSPPAPAEKLLLLVLTPAQIDPVLGDLAEQFQFLSERFDSNFARSWYWWQVLRSVFHLAGLRMAKWVSLGELLRLIRHLLSL